MSNKRKGENPEEVLWYKQKATPLGKVRAQAAIEEATSHSTPSGFVVLNV